MVRNDHPKEEMKMKQPYRVFTLTEKSDTKLVKKYVVIEKRRYMTPRTRYRVRLYDGWNSVMYRGFKVASLCEVATEIREWLGLPPKPTVRKKPSYEELEHTLKMLNYYLEDELGAKPVDQLKRQYIDPLISRFKAVVEE